jgi:hypothetical protein
MERKWNNMLKWHALVVYYYSVHAFCSLRPVFLCVSEDGPSDVE